MSCRLGEVKGMADRINGMRSQLKSLLVEDLGSKLNWDHISTSFHIPPSI
jgi:aspartate aminotransferase, mitochondrial